MSSFQSRLIYFVIRNRHLLKFHLKRDAWDENTSIPAFRADCEKGAGRMKLPEGIQISPAAIQGLPEGLSAEWIRPSGAPKDRLAEGPVIFYVHGGGYVSGSCADHRGVVAKVVKGSGVSALLYEYRLAPEHPFPAALDDTLTAYRWLLAQGASAAQTVIMGESAGGGLCLAALLAFRDGGLPLPAAGVSLSPWTDLTLSGESYRTRANAAIDPPGMSEVCSKYYAGDNEPTLPYISPLYGDLRGLPPLLIYVGDYETLRDDAVAFARKATEAGVKVNLHVVEGMTHCFPLHAPLYPEATEALADICAFIRRYACGEGQPAESSVALG